MPLEEDFITCPKRRDCLTTQGQNIQNLPTVVFDAPIPAGILNLALVKPQVITGKTVSIREGRKSQCSPDS